MTDENKSWLRQRAEQEALALAHKPRMAGIHPDDVADAIESVAREFAERALKNKWRHGVECTDAEAIAEADKP